MGITKEATASAVSLPPVDSSAWAPVAATATARTSVDREEEPVTTWEEEQEALADPAASVEATTAVPREDITAAAALEALVVVISAVGPMVVALVTMAVQVAVRVGQVALAAGERFERTFAQSVMDKEDLRLMEQRMEGWWSDDEEGERKDMTNDEALIPK
ncbi:hypothetical protein MPH_12041 [Macrophomina phaseolina MS6]|uniref:Uncharacterized protein n=1 Tax=Macrophomina phaseolina (strain MS6) TaxID=1126212 RepID=K2R9E6_MACPH|nr:hypothetical protein MPH_12041 [Macrophomina phaseolina MS6]